MAARYNSFATFFYYLERIHREDRVVMKYYMLMYITVNPQLIDLYTKAEVNFMIRSTLTCPHEEKIVISRCCPICKKIEHNNGCNECTTSEDLENDLCAYNYDPNDIYFVKRVCKTCKISKIQNETSAAA